MKKILGMAIIAFSAAQIAQAQETYLNDRATNTSDVIGTAQYVGMGGAMGALGGNISVISNNPAGIGIIRNGNLSFTLGGQIQDSEPAYGDSRGTFTFDQIGAVFSLGADDDGRLNFAFNYQKKANFNHSMYATQPLKGLAQGDLFSWVAGDKERFGSNDNFLGFSNPVFNAFEQRGVFELSPNRAADGSSYYRSPIAGETGRFYRNTSGWLNGFDFNVSGSVEDRYFFGLTVGLDRLNYKSSSSYEQIADVPEGSYILYQDQNLKGTGFNVKVGTIIRPVEDSPLRFGITVETPTWFSLKHTSWGYLAAVGDDGRYERAYPMDDYYNMYSGQSNDSYDRDNYLEYNLYTPWKFRASVGSSVEDFLVWDVEYEYSMNNFTKMGYPDNDDFNGFYGRDFNISMTKDKYMNEMTKRNVRGVHNIRAGFEVKPIRQFAIRAGYNFYSKVFKDDARLDQTCQSSAINYLINTDYINLGAAHLITLGLGYQGKHFFADVAYKYRYQRGDYYSFDDNFTSYNSYFIAENPNLKDVQLSPTEVNFDRHNIAVTLGCKF
ncbi:MAG: hypothetical protein J6W75_01065 [Bacteroidaceae bacterium]|nr:hypothetical protein [Bacteroidaceae bacterium]